MLSPVYTPAPLPWLPLPRRSAKGRRKNFPARKTREEKAIAGFRDLSQHSTEIFCKSLPSRTPKPRLCARWAGMGKGLRDTERAAGFIRHLPRSHRRPEAHTGAAPTRYRSLPSLARSAQRCTAKLRCDHNSNDHNEGDGSHPILSHPIPSRRAPTAPPRRLGNEEHGGNGGAVGFGTSPARMPLTAPRRDAEM